MVLPAEKLMRVTGPDRLSDPLAKVAAHEVDWHCLDAGHIQRLAMVISQATDEHTHSRPSGLAFRTYLS